MDEASKRPVVFGEVLFDCFPDGNKVLGGAPFNVAWHLQGLGLHPLMISSLGEDAEGREVMQRMQQWGMDCGAMQHDLQHPTGQVSIRMRDGEPSYDIVQNQAYDNIQASNALELLQNTPARMLYHGSLAARAPVSRSALQGLLDYAKATAIKVFVDINLRAPWWEPSLVKAMLESADWVKLNEDELQLIGNVNTADEAGVSAAALALYQEYSLELLIVTLGVKGAFCIVNNEIIRAEPVIVDDVIDTVGAGDSFSAVFIAGLLQHWPIPECLGRALSFAAEVCRMQGATNSDPAFYERFLQQWR